MARRYVKEEDVAPMNLRSDQEIGTEGGQKYQTAAVRLLNSINGAAPICKLAFGI
jgi:hypothetical protein